MNSENTEFAYRELETGPVHSFRNWPNREIPRVAAGVYTIWQEQRLIYAGMAGRGLVQAPDLEQSARPKQGVGLYSRLNSHASGRRSGDQFCVYVCDRILLRELTADQIDEIALGHLSLDAMIRQHIREHFDYRYAILSDGLTALRLENAVRAGCLKAGKPVLNPLSPAR